MVGAQGLALDPWEPPASQEQLHAFEQSSGFALPEDYKAFLCKQNGGDLRSGSPNAFPLGTNRSDYGYLVTVYPFVVGKNEPCTVPHMWHQNATWLPPELWPIADDGSGNYVCILLGDAEKGGVVYLEHELLSLPQTSIDELVDQEGFVPLTSSFTEFLTTLVYRP